ncbi:MAG: helicase HerA domain-containing protein, partial [Promethearchaeota archaeon]
MVLITGFFTLAFIILVSTAIFFILRIKEYELRKTKFIIFFFSIFMLLIYFFNIGSAISTPLSLFLILSSIFLFVGAFFITEQDLIELKVPSRYKSRKGDIKIGKIMKKNKKKHKFFLPLKDLERHMFICGTTGSGKSNFLQHFLINFKKRYDIPFLLAEFKGEYIFLQDIIEDLLIIRPGENFSINIFNPEGANPTIHAERLFDILKSGQFLNESAEFSP